ncbi:hypothetical protein ECLT68_2580 [Escherichia coli LT-68]|nr:hypothetical protein ECLT68_2580 [Escherichia coli LT-68]
MEKPAHCWEAALMAAIVSGTSDTGAPRDITAPVLLVIFRSSAADPLPNVIVVLPGFAPATVMTKAFCVVSNTTVATAAVSAVCSAVAAAAKLATPLKFTSMLTLSR